MFLQISVCLISRYLVSSVSQSLHLFFVISFYFPFLLQSACDKSSHCQNNATCQSGFTLKGYRCLCPPGFEGESCETGISLSQHLKWCIWEIFFLIFNAGMTTVLQLLKVAWICLIVYCVESFQKKISYYILLCALFSSLNRLYIFVRRLSMAKWEQFICMSYV